MTIETEVAALATSVNVLTGQVNTSLNTLTNSVNNASTSATNAETHKNSTSTLKTETGALKDLAVTAAGNAGTAAASAYQDLAAIAQSKSETAVDIFVYDTSKDSDGGAWRNRTQGTSWYNETLNVSNVRGSRKGFPSVAVIVISAFDLNIYDGDDPAMPLWKNIGYISGAFATDGYSFESRCVTARDGKIVVGLYQVQGQISSEPGNYGGLIIFDYVADTSEKIRGKGTASNSGVKSGVNEVNWGGASAFQYGTKHLVYGWVNDVDMAVLPNAPIDAATGLPVPTIAAATREGTSVIKDDGTVVDITGVVTGTDLNDAFVFFNKDNYLFVGDRGSSYNRSFNVSGFKEMPATDVAVTTADITYKCTNSSLTSPNAPYILGQVEEMEGSSVRGLNGLTNLSHNYSTPPNSMVNYITDEYNTGWMSGDIQLATLMDTDDTNLAATELVTNGAFDADSDWEKSTGVTIANGVAVIGGESTNCNIKQANVLTVGKSYFVSVDVTAVVGSTPTLAFSDSSNNTLSTAQIDFGSVTTGTYTGTFTAEDTWAQLIVRANNTVTIDNVSVKEAVADRSHNSKPLQVVVTGGSILKDPVATGAELVSYKNFSFNGRYFEQAYNSNLDVISSGYTTPYTLMGWFKNTSQVIDGTVVGLSTDHNGGTEHIRWAFDEGKPGVWVKNTSGVATHSTTVIPQDTWAQVVWVNTGTNSFNIYIDGTFNTTITLDSARFPTNISNRTLRIAFGVQQEMSLIRLSTSVPTAEQIAKIYRDEEPLFRENAKCTLYGTVPYASALAYEEDKDLLHVGTASGRSVFKGIQRVANTTDAFTVALSAAAGIVAGE
jgi:hypothetical protein